MSKCACCRDPKKCGHYVKRRKYMSVESEQCIEYMGCNNFDLARQIVYGREIYKCPYAKGEKK
jgi:hypothetical protein